MLESPETLSLLQSIIDRSAATAGSAIRRNFIGGGWCMSAAEFVSFWAPGRMASISTVSASGDVHAVPLDPRLFDGKFYIQTFPDSQRLRDLRIHPRCAITSWDGPYRAVIVYGIGRQIDRDPTGRTAETAAEQRYPMGSIISVEVTPTRIYAIRPPAGREATRPRAAASRTS